MYPWVLPGLARSSNQLLFVGTFPIALATIVSGTALIAVPRFGQWARDLTWALWWIDVALTLASVFGLPVKPAASARTCCGWSGTKRGGSRLGWQNCRCDICRSAFLPEIRPMQ